MGVGEAVIGQLAELAGYLDERCFSLDPIAILDLMVERGFLTLAFDASFTGKASVRPLRADDGG
ncbi:MAG: hypothetical protein QHC89_08485 [Bosea sp. (in: a-proteobacteria)]|nr:hypothetical protein [Bosea sp. (in: a-proteobacteria)]